jgi:tRNA-specific 2-thiouridylase
MSRVVLALSGGVDSSVSAHLLKQAGHEVIGVFIQHAQGLRTARNISQLPGDNDDEPQPEQGCGSPAVAAEARLAAEGLGIPFEVLDLQSEFQPVINYFVDEYASGRTPNPCIFCNALIKFGKLFEYALSIGADHMATGHYARILNPETPDARLCRGLDPDKDQSYFLFNINREILPKLIFPVGEYTKPEIRRLASSLDLHAAERPDSQDICFVAKEEHARFVRQILSEREQADLSGPIVTLDGTEVGRHQGIEQFTVGQRKGIGVAMGEPHFVIRIDAEERRVVIGTRDQLARPELTAGAANWLVEPPSESFRADVKIRYRSKRIPATIAIIKPTRFKVIFDKPTPGIAPGQGAVCYDGDVVLGGGWIE